MVWFFNLFENETSSKKQLNTTLTTRFQVRDFLLRHNKKLRRRQQIASCSVDGQLQSGVL